MLFNFYIYMCEVIFKLIFFFTQVSPFLTVEVHSIKASALHSKLSHLILSHYDLASTTVTGIPMKEEQNASSSANYDVEIFHSSAAHTAILKGFN